MKRSRERKNKRMARQKSDSFNRNVSVYDENFEVKKVNVTGTYDDPETYEDAVKKFPDVEAVKEALIVFLRQKRVQEEISKVTGGIEEADIMSFIKPFRLSDEFKDLAEKAQTEAILAKVKTIPFLMEQLKSYCKNKAAERAAGADESE